MKDYAAEIAGVAAPYGTTGTGLDTLVRLILQDEGLRARIPASEIEAGAAAADAMNTIIVEGIRALGIAGDGRFTAADVRDLSDWVQADPARKQAFIDFHGDDEQGVETGFHLVQDDGDVIDYRGRDAIDTVADGIYHLVFGYDDGNIINEDGNRNADLEDLAWWMSELLEDELAAAAEGTGPLASSVDPLSLSTGGAGLDQLLPMITLNPGLEEDISLSEIREGAQAAADLNKMIVGIIEAEGLVNDGDFTASDAYAVNATIQGDPALYARFVELHGDDEEGVETGFHLVQDDGDNLRLYNDEAVDTVADGIYHIGFDIVNGRFENEDGNANASVKTVASWIEELLADDLQAGTLVNASVSPFALGATGTGLDRAGEIIANDIGLERKISNADIAAGIEASNTINVLILDAIEALGLANNGEINAADLRDINEYIRADAARYQTFFDAHGNDEGNVETGFHRVQNDGAESRLFGENAVDTVLDGLYHIGFEIDGGNLTNEDGNKNAQVTDAAAWLDALLTEADFAALANASVTAYVAADTGTGLDLLVEIINDDPRLERQISTSQIAEGAAAANGLNALILDGLEAVGAGGDGIITEAETIAVNQWIRGDADRLATFVQLHGDDENGVETGFHAVQGDGSRTELFDKNAIDTVADGIYHIGFEIDGGRFLNEDGDKNASVETVTDWLNGLLFEDLQGDALTNPALDPANVNTAAILRGTVASLESVSADGSTGHTEVPDSPDFDLSAGTVMFSVELNDLNGLQGLFSRDGLNNQDGGHTTVWADGDDIKVRVQNAEGPGEKSEYLYARNVLEAGEETHVAVSFDGSVTQLFIDGALIDAAAIDSSWTNADEDITVGAAATRQRDADDDNVSNVMNGTVSDLLVIDQALEPHEIQAVAGVTPTAGGFAGATPYNPDLAISGSTGTGLDTLVDIVLTDVGLAARISEADILGGAEAAHGMNEIIVEGIRALGLGNDGAISANEVRDLSDWVQADPARAQAFTVFHGDDEQNVETGFHLVQNDGAETYILGENAVNTVADGIYHLVFGYSGNNITNEDGNRNADLGDMAWWLSELLAEDLAAAASGSGALYNGAVTPYAPGVAAPWGIQLTGTGFDQIVDVVFNDPGLIRETSLADMVAGSEAAMLMSGQILSAIEAYGLLNDGDFTASDVYAVSEWIRTTPGEYAKFVAAHGNDEGDLETGYHRIQNDGAETYRNGDNAVNTVFDGIFHIGFEIANRRVTNEDGNANAAIEDVAWWISSLLEDEIESGALATGPAFAPATTGTGLDFTVETILADHGLSYKISELDIRGGAEAAAGMNEMIVQAIIDTGVAANGEIKHSDVRDINAWFQADDARYARFVELHGDDEEGIETGYHLVQNDGARLRLYDDNAVDTVFDGLYHIGFDIVNGRFQNEDGDKNASVNTVAGWLGSLLSDADLEALAALSTTEAYVHGSTGTGLDLLVNIITEDDGLATKIATSEIAAGARAAEAMNEIILEAIDGTGAALDGAITELDVYDINAYIRGDAALLQAFTLYHGDDEGDVETGFHLVQNDGARTELFDRNAVDTVADGIYHIGFEIDGGRFLNEDGNKNASVGTVAGWLNDLLAEDLDGDGLGGDDLVPDAAELADLQAAQVYGFVGPAAVSKSSGQIKVPDSDVFRLPAATIIAGFSVDDPLDEGAIFSRDSSGFDDGGHMTAWVDSEDVVVRFQSKTGEVTLRASEAVTDSDPHTLAVSFDGTLVTLFVDGVRYDAAAIEADWTETTENIWLGASAIRQGEDDDKVEDLLGGTVDFFSVYEGAFNFAEVQALIAAGPVEVPLPDGGAVVEPPEEGEEPDDPGDDPAGDPPADPPAEPAGTLSESLLLDLALYDTESDTLVTVIGPDTVYSAEDLSDMKLAIVAVAKPGVDGIGSVRIITPDGEQTENVSPYAQFGDTGGDLQGGIVFAKGEYPVEIKVFSGENGGGTLLEHVEFGFTVEEEPANAPPSDEDAPGEEDPGNGTPGDGEEPEDPATGGGTPPEDGDPAVAGLLEFGSVTTGQADAGTWHRVDFSETIVDARVVMGPMTLNGGHDAVVRVKDVTDDGFFFQIDEWDHHDGFHVVETLSWMAASEGTHTLADGTTIAAGRASAADETVVRIDMSDFTDTPAVFAQVASFNDTAAVTSRISDIDTSGFSVRMQEEEAADGLHGAEDVDWIAIGYGDGTEIDVASLDGVTHRGSDISFDAATGTVVAIADMQTFNGSDTADLRFSELGESDARIVIREERSRDGETRHIAEDLAVLTTSEGLHELYVA